MSAIAGGGMPAAPRDGISFSGGPFPAGLVPGGIGTAGSRMAPFGAPTTEPAGSSALPPRLARVAAAAALIRAYRWLEQALPEAPGAAALVPQVVAAVSLYTAQQYAACLSYLVFVYDAIAGLRAQQSNLPPLPS